MDAPASQTGKTALITGGSSGIGLELARLFAKDKYNLILVARDATKLRHIEEMFTEEYHVAVKPIVADLAHPKAVQQLHHILEKANVNIDVLVNNAGFGVYGEFASTSRKKEAAMMRVNMLALTQLTKLFLPGMIARKKGKILNIASTAAFQPVPLMAVYGASKAYVLSFSQAIANEVEGTGVTVTTLCPGPTKTDFQKEADMAPSRAAHRRLMAPEAVAQAGYQGLLAGKLVVIPGTKNRLLAFLARVLPARLVLRTTRKIVERE